MKKTRFSADALKSCALCPRECGADRTAGGRGFCGMDDRIKIARCAPHYWEEPCVSGENGSGAIFFSGCTLGCVYCQNGEISRGGKGFYLTPRELSEKMLELQGLGVHNINLVTPTHQIPMIAEAVDAARQSGLALPIVYNCGGYEKPATVRALNGLADVYLPDMKYYSAEYSKKYSCAYDYFEYAKAAINEMVKQTGPCRFDGGGIITRGVIVRHLMLPGLLFDSKKIIEYLYKTYKDDIYISLMCQYTPVRHAAERFPELDRKLPRSHYESLVEHCAYLGIKNMYIQEPESADSRYIPEFYGE